ncbi:MAG: 1,4-dihydroxy-2-naphthoate polyprenyltransferase [Bacteriovoracaceae bacterium]|nr:1,4-dihydroxy-2-naphthoate polyprenyltransferase [Bacteriovoracaceae bacterium]
MKTWLIAVRPKTLFASIGPVLLGLALAWDQTQLINPLTATLTLLCAVFLQIGTNLVNDYYDHVNGVDDHNRLGPTRVTSEGLLSPRKVKAAFILTFILSFLFGIILMYFGGWPIVIIGLSSILFAWAYTGGPIPLSYFGLGEFLALIYFGPIAVWGTWYIQTGNPSINAALLGLGPGLFSATLMAVNNLRDRENDEGKGKVTLAVILGEQGARSLPLLFVLLSLILPILLAVGMNKPSLFLAILVPFIFFKDWLNLAKGPIDQSLNMTLARTGKCLFLYCLALSFGLIL